MKFPYLSEYPIYIDGSNIAYSRHNKLKKPNLSDILLVYDYLIKVLNFKKEAIYCICDPTLVYHIDKPIEYKELVKEGIIIEAPKVADEFILSFALKHNFSFIISNDRFRQYIDQLPSKQWLEDRRISFLILNNEVCLSPNINYEKIDVLQLNDGINNSEKACQVSTLEVLERIEKIEGDLDLF